ncbi:hypothetical protein NPIL_498431 [Nephila pilipes]|uniref:Uncharacterized protein n=1 Tax=Nephila pilipes TaxID=299642 RepID=A0A8X6IG69_NEPPI|nr:hypothetical protein NPIL_498431 [Nephila pilipes]
MHRDQCYSFFFCRTFHPLPSPPLVDRTLFYLLHRSSEGSGVPDTGTPFHPPGHPLFVNPLQIRQITLPNQHTLRSPQNQPTRPPPPTNHSKQTHRQTDTILRDWKTGGKQPSSPLGYPPAERRCYRAGTRCSIIKLFEL